MADALWAYRNCPYTSTEMSALTYRHNVVEPLEITVPSLRVMHQAELTPLEFTEAMLIDFERLDETLMRTLNSTIPNKVIITWAYNKRVKRKSFREGGKVWKVVLLIWNKDQIMGKKWSPTWDGPYVLIQVLKGGAYLLRDMDRKVVGAPIND
ncbi:uncharacterized protein LOC131238908 [Magnolia sinica]|uniref:uncharacterized protein LOC131238908 n=1 Tax=Magnolia sinica TaxID=86752 RepID=UPI002658A9C2|nr:uncharacterized protein LOC131238908 [Magnolia sinica]